MTSSSKHKQIGLGGNRNPKTLSKQSSVRLQESHSEIKALLIFVSALAVVGILTILLTPEPTQTPAKVTAPQDMVEPTVSYGWVPGVEEAGE